MDVVTERSVRSVWLPLILIGSFFLRIIGIQHGLPYVYEHDEFHSVLAALRHGSGDLSPLNFLHGSLTCYLLAILFAVYYLVGRLQRYFLAPQELITKFVHDPTPFYMIGRLAMALLGTLVVGLTYQAAQRLYNRRVARLAATLVGVSVLEVNLSHLIKEEMLTSALLGVAFLYAVTIATRLSVGSVRRRAYGILGFWLGLATSAKYYAGIGVIWLAILACRQTNVPATPQSKVSRLNRLAIGLTGVVIGFLLGEPFAVLRVREFFSNVFGQWVQYHSIPNPGQTNSLILYLGHYLPASLGWPAMACALIGCVDGILIRERGFTTLLVSSFPLLWLTILVRSSAFPHFLIPALPFVAILAAAGASRILDRFPTSIPLWFVGRIGVVGVLMIPVLISSLRYDRYASSPDTRQVAKAWIEAHIPANTRIAIEGAVFETIVFGPPLEGDRETLNTELAEIRRRGGAGRFWQAKLEATRTIGQPRFALCKTMELTPEILTHCQAPVVVVVSDSADRSWSVAPRDRRPFLARLEQHYTLLKQFDPYPGLRFFPTMWMMRDDFPRLQLVGLVSNALPLVTGPRIRIFRRDDALVESSW